MHNRRVSVTFLLALVLAGLGTAMVVLPSTNGIRARDHAYAGAILQPSNGAFATFYVSPGGNDSATGNSTEPFQTIARAQEAVRALTPALGGDIIVYLRNGTYRLSSGLSFNQSDGTNGTFSVTYRSFPGETAVIDGGTEIAPSSWVVHDEAAGIWASYLGGMNFRQLYVRTSSGERHNTNDPGADPVDTSPYVGYPTPLSVSTPAHDNTTCFERRAIRARELVPENTFSIQGDGHGYKTTSGLLSNFAGWTTPFAGKVDGFPASIGSGLHYAQDIEFVYHLMWNLPRVHVYTLKENAIIMQQPAFSFARTKGGTQLGDTWPGVTQPIWVENAYALLDEPGEWYYDRFTGWLFYKPLACEPQPNATSIRFIVPSVETLVTIEGNGTSPVRNIRFEGITFKHANWVRPNVLSLGHVDLQANFLLNLDGSGNRGSERSPGTLVTTHTHGITIENCTFTKLGGAGIDFYHGTQDSSIVGCIFDDLSGTAVNVGSTMAYPPDPALIVRNNSVENNYFTNIAVEFKGGHGIWGGYVQDGLHVSVDNRAKDHRLRVAFPSGLVTGHKLVGQHYTVLEKPITLPEGKGWVQAPSTTDHFLSFVGIAGNDQLGHVQGLAIVTGDSQEHEVNESTFGKNVIIVTLVRSVGWLGRPNGGAGPDVRTPDAQCQGMNEFKMQVIPFKPVNAPSGRPTFPRDFFTAVDEALVPLHVIIPHNLDDFHNTEPLPAVLNYRRFDLPRMLLVDENNEKFVNKEKLLPATASFVSLSPASMVFTSLKKSEAADGYILRFYNAGRDAADAVVTLHPSLKFSNVKEVKLDEHTGASKHDVNRDGSKVTVNGITHDEIVTLKFLKA